VVDASRSQPYLSDGKAVTLSAEQVAYRYTHVLEEYFALAIVIDM
jgi:hypothetical protein